VNKLDEALEAVAEYVEARRAERKARKKANGQPCFFLNEAVEATIEAQEAAREALAGAIDARAREITKDHPHG
jgi:hypothetical protein